VSQNLGADVTGVRDFWCNQTQGLEKWTRQESGMSVTEHRGGSIRTQGEDYRWIYLLQTQTKVFFLWSTKSVARFLKHATGNISIVMQQTNQADLVKLCRLSNQPINL